MFKTTGFGQLSFDQPFVKLLAKNVVDSTRLSVDNGVDAGETWEGDRCLHCSTTLFFVESGNMVRVFMLILKLRYSR